MPALTLTDNGGPNLINSGVTLTPGPGSTYAIGGLTGLTAANGMYTLTVNAAVIQDQYGNPGSDTLRLLADGHHPAHKPRQPAAHA